MILRWFGRLFSRRRLERDLDKELRFHVDSLTQDFKAEGVNEVEARRRALAEFGGMEPARENTRDARGTRWVDDTFQDIRYALRTFRTHKGFTAAAVLSLAVGIGANAAVFRVIDGLIFHPLEVNRPQELFFIESSSAGSSRFSHPAYLQLAETATSASFAVMTSPTTMQLTVNGVAELRTAQLISGNWFSLLGIDAQAGRVLSPSDDTVQSPQPFVVLSDRYWARQYSRAHSAVGSTILVNNTPCTIIGVAAPDFTGVTVGLPSDVWLPVTMQQAVHHNSNASIDDAVTSKPWVPQDGIAWLAILGRAPESVDRNALLAALDGRYRQINETRLDGIQDANRRTRRLQDRIRITDASRGMSSLRRQLSPALTVLMTMVGLVLLVACANLANLLLARGAARSRELALRLSIGARRSRLVRQLLTESLTLATIGGLAGLFAAWWGAQGLLRLVSTTSTPVPITLPLDWRVVLFGLGATLTTGLLFGLVPALRLSRPQIQDSLKSGGRVIETGSRRYRLPMVKVLVMVQVAVSLLLLVGAALFFQTFQNLVRIDTGFDRESVITARFDTRLSGIAQADLPALYTRLMEEAGRIPGVQSATISIVGPATGSARISGVSVDRYTPPPDEDTAIHEEFVGPAYFKTLGIRLIAGRDFDEHDDERSPQVAVINETMARRFFGEASPIGRGFGYGNTKEFQVVGVAADVRVNGLRSDVPPLAYYPLRQRPQEYVRNLYIRTTGLVEPLIASLRQALKVAAPGIAVREVVTLGDLTERTVSAERLVSRLSAVFGMLGVAVACFGLYGTITYSVARRTNEIGVRLALGASPSTVRRMVLRETFLLVALGVAGGVGLVLALGRFAETQLYGLSPHDPLTISGMSVAVILIGLISGALPAWKASRVSPMVALRQDL